jgi:uncharacterized protein YukE
VAGAKSPSQLAPFAHDWVGGDIHGLSGCAGSLYGYAPQIDSVASALTNKVSQIVGDAGWQGPAASAFCTSWEHDSAGATALAVMISAAGDIVNTLAVNLANTESALEQAAGEAIAHGLPVGADGQPPPVCLADPGEESWRVSYQSFWNSCMLAASTARTQAAVALQRLGAAATGDGAEDNLGNADYTALFDTLAGFFGAQTRYRGFVETKLAGVKDDLGEALTQAREEARLANGRFGPWTDQGRDSFSDAQSRLSTTEDNLAEAQSAENPFSKVWGFSPSDIPSVASKLAGMDGLSADAARFTAGIPFVDVAAAGASTYFGAQDDMAKGVPWYAAYPGEAGGNVAAIAAGGYVGGLAIEGTAAGLGMLGAGGLGVSLAAGGAGVLAGGVVAYGVGDFAHNLIVENWSADIHQHGVIAGIGAGIGDSAVKTGHDFVKVGTGIAHGAESLWNSIF